MADADMVVMIGMGLEAGWLDQLFEQARADEAVVISLEEFIDPLPYLPMGGAGDAHGDEEEHEDDEDGHGHDEDADEHHEDAHGHDDDADEDHGHGHDEETDDDHGGHEDEDGDHEDAHDHHHEHGSEDPHFWFDPPRVRAAVTGLAQAMGAADPEHAAIYAERAARYGLELEELHSWIIEQVSVLSAEQRVLVTSHDSFQYFAHLYDFEVVGTIIPSLGTSAENRGAGSRPPGGYHQGPWRQRHLYRSLDRQAGGQLGTGDRGRHRGTVVHGFTGSTGQRSRDLYRHDAAQCRNDGSGLVNPVTE